MKTKLLILSFLFLPTFAQAKGDRGDRGPGGKRMEKMLETLNLTPEQKTEIQDLHKNEREENKARREKAKLAGDAFDTAVADPKSTSEKLTELHEAMIAGKTEQMRARFGKMLKMRSVLDESQRVEFQKLMKEKGKKRGKGEGKGKKRGKRD
ncbi:Spy/CpxP family protein refolding chaperone [Oligoflexaceae bacterium]|nr:Spy/CpxP family protein refolding chaperone [Oligoflexaceae bacterium]